MSSSVLPTNYYYFFWLVEPVLTIAGGVSAIFDPEGFGRDLLSQQVERSTVSIGKTSRGQMVICELGSCFILLAMISLSLLYLFKKHLNDRPAVQEKMVKGLLIPLAIADPGVSAGQLLHIAVSLLPLPMSHLKNPSGWSHILHCTVWITLTLFAVRVSWLLGIGRPTAKSLSVVRPTSRTAQRPIPLPKSDSELRVETLVQAAGESQSQTPRRRARNAGSRLAD